MKSILVTGASGFLGSAIVPELQKGFEVFALGHEHCKHGQMACDLREEDAVTQLIDQVCPDYVVHAAAYRDPDFCEQNPDESVRLNVDSTSHFAKLLPAHAKLIYISSDYVFDGQNPGYCEEAQRNPINRYGVQKVASEDFVLDRPGSIVLRIPVLIGQDLPGKPGFITKMKETIDQINTEAVLDDVLMRFPTWIGDVASVIRFLCEQDAAGIYHASSTYGGTRYALNKEMADVLGASFDHVKPSHEVVLRGAARPQDTQLNAEKLLKLGFPGFKPLVEVLEVLAV